MYANKTKIVVTQTAALWTNFDIDWMDGGMIIWGVSQHSYDKAHKMA